MAIGAPRRRSAPLRVGAMLIALVLAAFAGAAIGLVWQSADVLGDEPEDELVMAEEPGA